LRTLTHHSSHTSRATIVGSAIGRGNGGRARRWYFRSSEKYSVSIMWVVSETVKDVGHHVGELAGTERYAAAAADGGQGHGRCSVERCFLKCHRSRGVSSIGGFVCHPVEWQLGSLFGCTRARTGQRSQWSGQRVVGRGAVSVKRQCCVRHGGLRCPELQYRIGFHHDRFRPAGGFFPHATSRTPAQKRPPRRPLKPASVLL
jgi:hypothetical protein